MTSGLNDASRQAEQRRPGWRRRSRSRCRPSARVRVTRGKVGAAILAPGRERVLGVFDLLLKWYAQDDFRGCAILNAAAEQRASNPTVTRLARLHLQAYRDFLAASLTEAAFPDPQHLAAQLLILIEGATVISAINGAPTAGQQARALAERLLRAEGNAHATTSGSCAARAPSCVVGRPGFSGCGVMLEAPQRRCPRGSIADEERLVAKCSHQETAPARRATSRRLDTSRREDRCSYFAPGDTDPSTGPRRSRPAAPPTPRPDQTSLHHPRNRTRPQP